MKTIHIPDEQNRSLPEISRRQFLNRTLSGLLAANFLPFIHVPSSQAAAVQEDSMHILYFSHSGNTRTIASYIHELTGSAITEITTPVPYPTDYNTVVEQARHEQQAHARPELSMEIPKLDGCRTVFIGFPNWWGTMPMPLFTLLEKCDLGDREVVPFCTHEGSRFGRSESDLRSLCPHAHIREGFETRGSRVKEADHDVDLWLRRLGYLA